MLSVSNRCVDATKIDPQGDLLDQCPVLNPVLANLHYNWPVQRIQPRVPVAPADTYLVVFRDVEDEIQFMEGNAFTARLLTLLEPGTLTGRAALEIVADESRHPNLALLIEGGLATLQNLHARGAVLGTVRAA